MRLSPAQKRSLARDGYAVVPRVAPRARVDAALREINHALGRLEERVPDPYGADYLSYLTTARPLLDLLDGTPLRALVESLLGAGRVEPVSQAQVALRFPAPPGDSVDNRRIHIDGLTPERPGVVERFTLVAGVLLSDQPRPNCGNLMIYPGTHRKIARAFAAKGLSALDRGVGEAIDAPAPVHVTGKAGDAVLLHHETAHDKAFNASPHVRYMAYFRVYHSDAWRDRSPAYVLRALSEPWLEWPGMRGVRAA